MKIPHKENIESSVIATILHHPELIKVAPLKDEHFHLSKHKLAFKVLKEMEMSSEKINIVTFGGRYMDNAGKISHIDALFQGDEWFSPLFLDDLVKQLAEETAKRKILENYNTLADAPKQFIAEVKKLEQSFIEQKSISLSSMFDTYREHYKEDQDSIKSKGSTGLITGFSKIDSNCPFEQGNLVILAAKTSVGKTSLSLNIAINVAAFGQRVLFFSAEMTTNELRNRVFSQLTGVSSTKFKYRDVDATINLLEGDINAISSNLSFVEAGSLTSEDISRISHQESEKGGLDLVIVDYIQYLKDQTGKSQNNNDRIGIITRNLKALAMDLKCSVLALSQVNRATKGIPELENLRDSGNIEQDADIVLIVHREDKDDVTATLVGAKNRNGQVFRSELKFKPSLTKFYE